VKRKLQVFVSSTFTDLIEERQAAVSAILKAGHIPAGMELFTAGDKSQMKTIERWIDESDVYMLILGGRYGSIEPTTGLSYTELEYDYAIAHQKPSFAVVITPEAIERKVKDGGTKFIEKENPKPLEQFRTKVLGNISSFFNDTKDVTLCIYESMSDHAVNPDLKGWIAADEMEDSKVLHEELKKLREENAALNQALREPKSDTRLRSEALDIELIRILKAVEVNVPPALAAGKDIKNSLLEIAYNNRDMLITGVTNAVNGSVGDNFLYFNIFPKLQVHGLANNEAVAGARYRRSYLNKAGQQLFAEMEKRMLLSKEAIVRVPAPPETGSEPEPRGEPQHKPDQAGKDVKPAKSLPRSREKGG
jgi:hypothetical protein